VTERGGVLAPNGMAEVAAGDASYKPVRVPSILRCGLLILAVKLTLWLRGFGPTTRWIRSRVAAVPTRAMGDSSVVKTMEYAVATAGALYPGRALCLEQSLVLYYLLRRQGVPVTFVMGVQPYPFIAHAWVEYCGHPVNDVVEHVKRFARLANTLQ